MSHKFRLPIIIGSVITIFVLAAVLDSMALAQEDAVQGVDSGGGQVSSEITVPVPGGPGFISVSSMAFQPFLPTTQFRHTGPTLYCISGNCVFDSEVALPNGATITKVVMYYYDDAATEIALHLYRAAFDDAYVTDMAYVVSSGTGTSFRYTETTTIVTPVIDNQSKSYIVEVWLNPTVQNRFLGVRVDYAYPTGLPLVEK